MSEALVCTRCDEIVIKSVGGETKLRSKVIIFRDDLTFAVCKGCGTELPIPVKIDVDMMKSVSSSSKVKLFVKK